MKLREELVHTGDTGDEVRTRLEEFDHTHQKHYLKLKVAARAFSDRYIKEVAAHRSQVKADRDTKLKAQKGHRDTYKVLNNKSAPPPLSS